MRYNIRFPIRKTLLILAAVSVASCNKQSAAPEPGYGYAALKILQTPQIEVAAKASPDEITDDYRITISQGADVMREDTYGNLKHFVALREGGYDVFAQSRTEAQAIENRGCPRYTGTAAFIITEGANETVSFECSMANARVSVGFTEDFKTTFSEWSVKVYENSLPDRKISFDKTAVVDDPDTWCYVNVTNDPNIIISVSGTLRLDNAVRNFEKKIPIARRTWYKVTLNATSMNGQAGLDLIVDNTLLEQRFDMDIDPYL